MIEKSSWEVTSQRPTTQNNGVSYVPAMLIGFRTGRGNVGTITVDAADYTEAEVRKLIQRAADTVDEIGSLKSG